MTIKTTKDQHYVDNKKLLKELSEHRERVLRASELGQPKPRLSDYIGECIMLIAKRLSNRPNFINYPFKEEMIGDGIENCLMYIDNFDPNISSNAFAYITQIIYFAFIRRITKEKKHLYTKHKLFERSMIFTDDYNDPDANVHLSQQFIKNEHMEDFVRSFEETVDKKRKKKKIGVEKFIDGVEEDSDG